jgi:hypothetical protein
MPSDSRIGKWPYSDNAVSQAESVPRTSNLSNENGAERRVSDPGCVVIYELLVDVNLALFPITVNRTWQESGGPIAAPRDSHMTISPFIMTWHPVLVLWRNRS